MAHGGIHADELVLDGRIPHVGGQGHGIEIIEGKLFAGLAEKGFLEVFPIADVAPNGSVPIQGEDGFLRGTVLEVDAAEAVDDMEMHHGVEEFCGVAVCAGGPGHDRARGLDHREHLPGAFVARRKRGYANRVDQFHFRERL